ncbi:MAG: DNA repair protein RecO [Fimbriimonadales bacterium]|nr:DNA repair protein RecO [Fimbriimonadales bacterium]
MAREILTEGIVLRRWYAGEYDKWISFLTPEHGKLRLRVRGARKPTSKMGMLTEPLNRLKARVIEGRTQKLVAQPQLVRGYVPLRTELERLSIALALCETLDRWLPDEHAEPEAYATLILALESLESGVPAEWVAAWALWRWLAMLGYSPDRERCGRCGKALPESVEESTDTTNASRVACASESVSAVLLPTEGLLLCARCAAQHDGIVFTPESLQRLQRWMQGERLSVGSRPEVGQSLVRAALRYAECVLESPVRWLEFWARLNTLRENG